MFGSTKFRGAQALVIGLGGLLVAAGHAAADNVIADNLIVQGSACIGLDCVSGESFGFGTLRLKENNTRIDFIDTSASAGFATRDWRLEANSSGSGGANYFAIKDMGDDNSSGNEGGNALFTVTAGAPANSLFVDANGFVGIGTATPGLKLHINKGDTPGLRLEQDTSGGFTAQTWDIAGNESNFFVRDLTGGGRLPFRIRPGAPTSSIDIAASGFVGFGTASPAASIHVSATNPAIRLDSTGTVPSQWAISSSATSGRLLISDLMAGTTPIRIRAGAPNSTMEIAASGFVGIGTISPLAQLHTTGTVRFAGLPNCAGLKTNSVGQLSCTTTTPAAASVATFADRRAAKAGRLPSGPGTVASLGGTAGNGGASDPSSSESAAEKGCSAGDMLGGWSLIGTNIEMVGANSVLWCDVNLTLGRDSSKPNYSITGNCRSHLPNQTTPDNFTVVGDKSITETAACHLGGTFKVKHGAAVVTTASIVEGRIEGPADKKTRVVAVSRWPRGQASSIQTFVMQR